MLLFFILILFIYLDDRSLQSSRGWIHTKSFPKVLRNVGIFRWYYRSSSIAMFSTLIISKSLQRGVLSIEMQNEIRKIQIFQIEIGWIDLVYNRQIGYKYPFHPFHCTRFVLIAVKCSQWHTKQIHWKHTSKWDIYFSTCELHIVR